MEIQRALERISAAGINLYVRDGALAFQAPPGVMTAERREWIAKNKSALLEALVEGRGPCSRCGGAVTGTAGFRNWYGELVHLVCPAPAPERERIGSCAYCCAAAYVDDAVRLATGGALHHRCADVWALRPRGAA